MNDLDYLFHPSSIAIVGVSSNSENWGSGVWPQVLEEMGFSGDIYVVNPDTKHSGNSKSYSTIRDIPGDVDLAILSVPAAVVPQIIEDCAAKRVRIAHVFSAGFIESGDEGARLEKQMVELARKGQVRVLGPNCMGVYHPSQGICWRPDFPRDSGNLAFLSQSGFNASNFLKQSVVRGIRFSKLVSYGNACDLNETDFLEYLVTDPQTEVIAIYMEGVKDGQRFFRVLREVTRVKPVIILKGGKTEAGTRATVSHTGMLAAESTTWDSLFKQTGAVGVDSMEELVDTALVFLRMSAPLGRRVALIGQGGGPNVIGSDDCSRAGLSVPLFSPEIKRDLYRFTPKAGTSVANPVDIIVNWTPENWNEAIGIIGTSVEVDALIIHLGMTFQHLVPKGIESLKRICATVLAAVKSIDKPVAVVIYSGLELEEVAREESNVFLRAGIPVFSSISAAARSIGRLLEYQDYRRNETKVPG